MEIDDRTFLRLHIEAVWNIQLPSIVRNEIDIPAGSNQPPWLLYITQIASERIFIWHANVDTPTRQSLLTRAESALASSGQADKTDIEREVAFKFTGQPRMELARAQYLAHSITTNEQTQIEAFQSGKASYFFTHGPLFGTIVNGRLLSIAHSSRRTTGACELGIETQPEARRHGYALASTILWTYEVLREQIVPIYSALAENTASLALADAAGYRPFARGISITNSP